MPHPRYCDSSDLFTDVCSNSGKDYWLMLPLISQFLACTTGVSEIDTVSLVWDSLGFSSRHHPLSFWFLWTVHLLCWQPDFPGNVLVSWILETTTILVESLTNFINKYLKNFRKSNVCYFIIKCGISWVTHLLGEFWTMFFFVIIAVYIWISEKCIDPDQYQCFQNVEVGLSMSEDKWNIHAIKCWNSWNWLPLTILYIAPGLVTFDKTSQNLILTWPKLYPSSFCHLQQQLFLNLVYEPVVIHKIIVSIT